MLLVLAGRLIQFLLLLTGMRIMTQLLPPEEVGKIALIATSTAFFALFLIHPVGMFINRRLHAWVAAGTVRSYLNAYWLYVVLVAIAAALVLLFVRVFNSVVPGIELHWLVILVSGSLVFNTANQTLIPSLNLLGHQRPFVYLTVGTVACGLLVAGALVVWWRQVAEMWMLGLLLGQVVMGLLAHQMFFSRMPAEIRTSAIDTAHLRRLYQFAWPVAIGVALNWLQMQGYRFALAEHFGLAEFGLFIAGYGIAAQLLAALEIILNSLFQPDFYRRTNAAKETERRWAWQIYAGPMLPMILIGITALIASAPYVTAILLSPSYHSAWKYVGWGAMAEGCRVLVGVFGLTGHATMNTRKLVVPYAVGAIGTLGTMLLLVPEFGLVGAPMSITAGGVVAIASMWTLIRDNISQNFDYGALAASLINAGITILFMQILEPYVPGSYYWRAVAGVSIVSITYIPIIWWLLRRYDNAITLMR